MSYNNLLPTDWYHLTLNQAEKLDKYTRIVFTIDRGEFAYRNIVERYPHTKRGMKQLRTRFKELGYDISTDRTSDIYIDQFLLTKIRAKAKVDRVVKNYSSGSPPIIKNIIIELQPPTKPEDFNVRAKKTDEFYNKNNKGRDLPINE